MDDNPTWYSMSIHYPIISLFSPSLEFNFILCPDDPTTHLITKPQSTQIATVIAELLLKMLENTSQKTTQLCLCASCNRRMDLFGANKHSKMQDPCSCQTWLKWVQQYIQDFTNMLIKHKKWESMNTPTLWSIDLLL